MTPRVFKFNKPSNWKPESEVKAKPAVKAKQANSTYENEFAMTSELEMMRQALRNLWDEYKQTKLVEERARQYTQPYYGVSSTINTQDSNNVTYQQSEWMAVT